MVINLLTRSVLRVPTPRKFCTHASVNVELLKNRSIIKLLGGELFGFVQGLITNDIQQLSDRQNSLYTFFLNNKGRILFDGLMYKISAQEMLVECDSLVRDSLMKHIKVHCVRKKIDVVPQDYHVSVLFNANRITDFSSSNALDTSAWNTSDRENRSNVENVIGAGNHVFRDPRLSALGARILSAPSVDIVELLNHKQITVPQFKDFATYRYELGVAEGVNELLERCSFPHEANGDYLRGISFNKGCYIGQELTARVQHTGVVRKRLMPLILSYVPDFVVERDSLVTSEDGKKIGKLRIIRGKYGIALLRVDEAFENQSALKVAGIPAFTYKPFWWPL